MVKPPISCFLLCLLLVACGRDADPAPTTTSGTTTTPWIELGEGVDSHTPLSAGDELPLIRGPVGGWFHRVSVRFDGLEGLVRITATTKSRADGTLIASLTDNLTQATRIDDAWQVSGVTLEFEHGVQQQDACPWDGTEAELCLELLDAPDTTLSDCVDVVIVVDRQTDPCAP